MAKNKTNNPTRRVIILLAVLFGLVIVVAVVGAATGLFGGGEKGIEVETADVEVRSITQVVTASGKAQPEVEVKISPDVSGEIIDLRVREGDRVDKGELLVRIKQDDYRAQVEQAQAGVLQSKATAAQRKADLLSAQLERDRQEELFKVQAVSESEVEKARTLYEVAKAAHEASQYGVQSAEARMRESRDLLSKTTIYAPMGGTISVLNVEFGERVVGTSQMAGTEMMRIARLDQMELEVDVNENDVVNIVIGDTASIEIDAYPDKPFRGMVTEIANSARTTGAGTQEQVTNFPVKIRILDDHNADAGILRTGVSASEVPPLDASLPNFRPGMSGTVDIFTQTIDDAVAIPIQAVTVRDFAQLRQSKGDEGEDEDEDAEALTDADTSEVEEDPASFLKEDLRKVTFLVEDGKAKMVEVVTGISDDTHIEIKSGVEEGAKCIVGPYSAVSRTLKPDMKVREKSKDGPGAKT